MFELILEVLLEFFGELILQFVFELEFLGRVRSRRNLDRIPLDTFTFGYLFALCFALARFVLAH